MESYSESYTGLQIRSLQTQSLTQNVELYEMRVIRTQGLKDADPDSTIAL